MSTSRVSAIRLRAALRERDVGSLGGGGVVAAIGGAAVVGELDGDGGGAGDAGGGEGDRACGAECGLHAEEGGVVGGDGEGQCLAGFVGWSAW